jgi:alpha-aminoadipate carrier protein LysW
MTMQCLVCAEPINVAAGTLAGEIVPCGACGQEHEVLRTDDGVKLALAPEVEEDWGE